MTKRIVSLIALPSKQYFRFADEDLNQIYKNTFVVREGDTSVAIGGYVRDGKNEPYKAIHAGYRITAGVQVYAIDDPREEVEETVKVVKDPNAPKGVRGRKAKIINFVLPKGEFTMKQLAELNKVNVANAYVYLHKKMVGQFKVVREVKSDTGRGKPTKIFKSI